MSAFSRVSAFCVLLSAITVFSGCSKKSDNWLIGKWAFDLETTKANIPADNKAQGVPDNVAKQMGEQLTNQLLSQMNNTEFHFTATRMAVTVGNVTKDSCDYKIIKRPDANTIVVKGKDAEGTFIRSGKYLCIPPTTTGNVQFKMYFKPVN